MRPAEMNRGPTEGQVFSELYDPGSESWIPQGNLRWPLGGHRAILLLDGRVLVVAASGLGSGGASTNQYDPVTGNWEEVGTLRYGRYAHTATLLPDGNVLVAGGSGIAPASAELYDRNTRVWSATGSMGERRESHAASLLRDGKVLVAAGYGKTYDLATAELYDPVGGTWSATGSLGTGRQSPTATLLANGKVLLVGGTTQSYGSLASAELYDPDSGIWSATGSLDTARDSHAAVLLPNGKVLVVGGVIRGTDGNYRILSSAELYDPATGTWSVTGSLGTARQYPTATLLPSGKVLALGSHRQSTEDSPFVSSAELYDPATGTWSATGSPNRRYGLHTATLLPNGKVVVAAGIIPYPAQLLNISTRAQVLAGDNVAIAGFIIRGYSKSVTLRAIGPSLPLGARALQDPVLELYRGDGRFLVRNDNWKTRDDSGQSQEEQIKFTTIPPNNDLESAIHVTLESGAYTAIVRGKDGGTGIGLLEVYDSSPILAVFVNISTRGFVGTGDNVMIGGFIAGPNTEGNQRVLLRARGPSLPVAGPLADPTLTLYDSNGATIALNDNWKIDGQTGESQEAAIRAAGLPPPPDDRESSIALTVAPGAYTAILRGKSDTTGVALVEVYDLE